MAAARLPPPVTRLPPGGLVLEVEGAIQPYPLAEYHAVFEENAVPRCQCVLAVGRRPGAPGPPAPPAGLPVARVWGRFEGTYGRARTPWPAGRLLLFEGRLQGGFRPARGADQVGLQAVLVHWLGDLAEGSAAAGAAAVSAAGLAAGAVLGQPTGSAAAGGAVVSNQIGGGGPAGFAVLAQADLWAAAQGLYDHFTTRGSTALYRVCRELALRAGSARAKAALARIEGGLGPPYRYGAPTPVAAGVPVAARYALGAAVVGETVAAYAGSSLWDKLVGQLCPGFGLAVRPRVADASVAVDTPYRRATTVWAALAADDYATAEFPPAGGRAVAGVAVVGRVGSETGPDAGGPAAPFAAGCHVAAAQAGDDEAAGLVHVLPPPGWLAGALSGHIRAQEVSRAATGGATPGPAPAAGASDEGILDRYARDAYHRLVLQDRHGSLSGPLRLDVAPGSWVRVAGRLDQTRTGVPDGVEVDRVGRVTRVTVTLNAAANRAGTSFDLAYVRTAADDASDRWSWAGGHPLSPAGAAALPPGGPLCDGLPPPPAT